MKLAIITLCLFFITKMAYGLWGDYNNDYWSCVYFTAQYIMMIGLLRYIYLVAHTRLQRQIIGLGILYFSAMLITECICLFRIDLYNVLVSNAGYWGAEVIVLLIGLAFINFIRLKSHDN